MTLQTARYTAPHKHKVWYYWGMRVTYQYRLLPRMSQRTFLAQTLELCWWVRNQTLAIRTSAWEEEPRSVTHYDAIKMLPGRKEPKSDLREIPSQVLQETCTRLQLAFQAFSRRVKTGEKAGSPRFRGYSRCDRFTYPQPGFELKGAGLYLSKIGIVKITLHRPICGVVKTLTIDRDALENWQAKISCEVDPEPFPKSEAADGIEVGLESFTTLTSGEKVANRCTFRGNEKELAKAQRKLPKAEKGRPDRAKCGKGVVYIHQRTTDRRKYFAHKLARQLVNEHGVIALEKLNGVNLLQNHRLVRYISDAAWSKQVQPHTYKAGYAGCEGVLVDPKGTWQRCSGCAMLVNKKSLCLLVPARPRSGLEIGRDINAAINILTLWLQGLGIVSRSYPAGGVG